MRVHGSYPAASGAEIQVDPITTDEAFVEARGWLDRLRALGE